MENLTKTFKALSDANRIRILKMLEVRPLCVCEITAVLGLAASTVSKHLSILREAGLIFDLKEGKWVNYYLNTTSQQNAVKDLLPLIRKWLTDDRQILQDKAKAHSVDRETLCNS